jgi:hypothetical protein
MGPCMALSRTSTARRTWSRKKKKAGNLQAGQVIHCLSSHSQPRLCHFHSLSPLFFSLALFYLVLVFSPCFFPIPSSYRVYKSADRGVSAHLEARYQLGLLDVNTEIVAVYATDLPASAVFATDDNGFESTLRTTNASGPMQNYVIASV